MAGKPIDPENTLIILDEIQETPGAQLHVGLQKREPDDQPAVVCGKRCCELQ